MERINEDPRVTTVFYPNPVHQLQYYYPEDHNDSNFMLLYLAYREVVLPDLMPDPWDYYLVGDYVEIFDSLPYFTEQAISPDGIFPYYRCDDEFEEVMCYYHIDRSQRYIQSIGFLNACNRPVKVDAHAIKAEDEYGIHDTLGWYQPNWFGTGYICLGDGGVDWGEDGDVILHEYGHAVQDNQAPGIYSNGNGDVGFGNETLIMCEGFAHYWACSMTDSASKENGINCSWVGEWVVKGFDRYTNYLYTLDNDKLYPDHLTFDPDRAHEDAELWGGALWDIFETLGKKNCRQSYPAQPPSYVSKTDN